MRTPLLLLSILLLLSGLVLPAALAAGNTQLSPAPYLNADGALAPPKNVSGSLDLAGWNVQLDPARGPLFSPARRGQDAPFSGSSEWSALGSNGAGNGALGSGVGAVAVLGGDVYVGGSFTDVSNSGTTLGAADYIAKWDGSNWSSLGSNGAGNGALNNTVLALVVSGSDLFVGGRFTNVNNNGTALTAADYIAKWDGANWSALGSNGAGDGALGVDSEVHALTVNGSDLVVGGGFANVNNNGTVLGAADFIAKWDGTNWSSLGSNGAGGGSLTNAVHAIAVSGGNVYVGGDFTDVNNHGTVLGEADYLAKWDGANWSALGSNGAGNGSLNLTVWALVFSGADLVAGGQFYGVNNNGTELYAADYIAKWDGTNWSALGSGIGGENSLNGVVYTLALDGADLYVGGDFTDVANNGATLGAADYIAKWDGTNWSSLGSNGAGNGSLN